MPSKIQLSFECSVRADRDRLHVSYEVRNGSGRDAGLFNHVGPVESGSPISSPDNVYIDFESGLLELLKQVLPIPGGMQVSSQPMPLVSKLPNGASLKEQFSVGLPAKANNPMRQMVLTAAHRGSIIMADDPTEAFEVNVCIGAFAVEPGMRFIETPAGPSIFRIWPPGPAVDGQVLLSKTIRLPHAVRVLAFTARKPQEH
ncbi:MAG: hypothetical protein M3Y57_02120 [Acidobacteriota bacterium]|nr:hypothetical protein [Acidobacteriota bacterium]